MLDYGAGNLRSVVKAFEHQGASAVLSSDPEVARRADRLVLPGQGHFGQCVGRLRERGLDEAIAEVVDAGKPFLGICVGMQLLYQGSEEAPDAEGLGLLDGEIRKIPTQLHLPHVGWNSVEFRPAARDKALLAGVAGEEPVYFYHVHSFAQLDVDSPAALGICTYEVPFVSVAAQDNVWGIQFHPEKSQEFGLRILANFLEL